MFASSLTRCLQEEAAPAPRGFFLLGTQPSLLVCGSVLFSSEGYVSLLLALLLVLLLHVAVIVGLFGHHERNALVTAPANTLSAAL